MKLKSIIELFSIILLFRGCFVFEWTHTNLEQYGNNAGVSLKITNDTSFFLVTYWDSLEVFKSKDRGKNWNKLYSFNRDWFYDADLLDGENLYIAMKNKADTCYAISKCSLIKNNINSLILPDSTYCEYKTRLWMGEDNELRILLKSIKSKNRMLYRITQDFKNLVFERSLPDSMATSSVIVINDSSFVYKDNHTNNVVINYPNKASIISSLKGRTPCLVSEGNLYLTSLDSTDSNVYSYYLAKKSIDTIPSFPLPKYVFYAKQDTLVTRMRTNKHHIVFGEINNKGQSVKYFDPGIVFVYCTTVYNGKLYIYHNGQIRHYEL